MDILKFSQLLSSRLCHDLITPVGAISNGFELLQDCDEEERPMLESVTRQSAANAVRRLRYFRAAYGYSSHPTFDAVKQTIDAFVNPIKIKFSWKSLDRFDQQESFTKLLPDWERLIMNCVLLGSEGMPYGGEITLESDEVHNPSLKFSFKGKLAVVREELIKALEAKLSEEEKTSQTVQGIMIKMLADKLDLTLEINVLSREHYEIMLKSA